MYRLSISSDTLSQPQTTDNILISEFCQGPVRRMNTGTTMLALDEAQALYRTT